MPVGTIFQALEALGQGIEIAIAPRSPWSLRWRGAAPGVAAALRPAPCAAPPPSVAYACAPSGRMKHRHRAAGGSRSPDRPSSRTRSAGWPAPTSRDGKAAALTEARSAKTRHHLQRHALSSGTFSVERHIAPAACPVEPRSETAGDVVRLKTGRAHLGDRQSRFRLLLLRDAMAKVALSSGSASGLNEFEAGVSFCISGAWVDCNLARVRSRSKIASSSSSFDEAAES